MPMSQAILEAVRNGRLVRQQMAKINYDKIDRSRSRIAEKHKGRVDKIIARLPATIERAVSEEKYVRGYIKIAEVNIREMVGHDCGLARPRPGTYVEYLCERLKAEGLEPQCVYDNDGWFGRWHGMMGISEPKTES